MSPTSMKGILLRGNTIIGKSLEARDPLGLKLVGCGGGQCGKDRLELHNERCSRPCREFGFLLYRIVEAFPQYFIVKIFKHTKMLKEFYSQHPYQFNCS